MGLGVARALAGGWSFDWVVARRGFNFAAHEAAARACGACLSGLFRAEEWAALGPFGAVAYKHVGWVRGPGCARACACVPVSEACRGRVASLR
eukprot:12740719-Alexandrium_andersonii.AAC.1